MTLVEIRVTFECKYFVCCGATVKALAEERMEFHMYKLK
jgi:hypothetical protein